MTTLAKIKDSHPECKHSWAMREKIRVQSMLRFCTNCGDEDILTDDEDATEASLLQRHKKQKVI